MNQPKCFFQLVDKETGVRSPVVGVERKEYAQSLLRWTIERGEGKADSTYVLVLVDDIVEGKWSFSQAPLLTVRSFIEQFAGD